MSPERPTRSPEAFEGDVDKTPGTRAYQERLEAAGQQRLDLAGAS